MFKLIEVKRCGLKMAVFSLKSIQFPFKAVWMDGIAG